MGRFNEEDQYRLLDQDSELGPDISHPSEKRRCVSSSESWKNKFLSLLILVLLSYISALETIEIATRPACQNSMDCTFRNEQRSKLSVGRSLPGNSYVITDLIPEGVLRYQQRKEWVPFQYPWNIEPSPELDAVWEEFLYGQSSSCPSHVFISIFWVGFVLILESSARNVRLTLDEMIYLQENLTDLIQVDRHDYPAVMGVFHHLHCLNNLRKIVHWDYYGPLLEGGDESLSQGHSGVSSDDDAIPEAV